MIDMEKLKQLKEICEKNGWEVVMPSDDGYYCYIVVDKGYELVKVYF